MKTKREKKNKTWWTGQGGLARKIRNNPGEKRPVARGRDRRYRYLTLPVDKSVEKQQRMAHFLEIVHAPRVNKVDYLHATPYGNTVRASVDPERRRAPHFKSSLSKSPWRLVRANGPAYLIVLLRTRNSEMFYFRLSANTARSPVTFNLRLRSFRIVSSRLRERLRAINPFDSSKEK